MARSSRPSAGLSRASSRDGSGFPPLETIRQTRPCGAGRAAAGFSAALHRLWAVACGAARETSAGSARLAPVRSLVGTMELEFHQLDLRYERLRVRQLAPERRLLASLADTGQQMPIVVVTAASSYVVVDGHKRVRCLRQLHQDLIAAVAWEMSEPEALIFRQLLRTDATDSAFEQGWLLRTLQDEHGVALDALARRFDRSVSWVSRRVSLVRTLPDAVQQHVHDGRLVAHAAMKYFVPLARANAPDCVRLVEAIVPHRLSTPQIGRLYQAYVTGVE